MCVCMCVCVCVCIVCVCEDLRYDAEHVFGPENILLSTRHKQCTVFRFAEFAVIQFSNGRSIV